MGKPSITAHVVAAGATNRENLYVSMTRGRESNTVYVALDNPDDTHTPPQEGDVNARTVLYGILQRSGAELSAHQTITAEQDQWSSIAQLRSEEHTSELQSLMRISYAVFVLKNKNTY